MGINICEVIEMDTKLSAPSKVSLTLMYQRFTESKKQILEGNQREYGFIEAIEITAELNFAEKRSLIMMYQRLMEREKDKI